MNLINDWKRVLAKAWSVRLAILAGALSGVELVLPLFQDIIPRGPFAGASFLLTAAAVVARIVAQPGMRDGD